MPTEEKGKAGETAKASAPKTAKAKKAKAKKKSESKVDKYVRANKNHPDNKESGGKVQIVQPPSKEAIEDMKIREQSAEETKYETPDWRDLPPTKPVVNTVQVKAKG